MTPSRFLDVRIYPIVAFIRRFSRTCVASVRIRCERWNECATTKNKVATHGLDRLFKLFITHILLFICIVCYSDLYIKLIAKLLMNTRKERTIIKRIHPVKYELFPFLCIDNDELIDAPIFVGMIWQVPSNDNRNLALF